MPQNIATASNGPNRVISGVVVMPIAAMVMAPSNTQFAGINLRDGATVRPKTLAVKDDDGGITIEVADTGVGIAEETISGALTPFTQVGEDAAEREEGAGLGLPLAKSLVELHGGTLELRSSMGAGTVVMINFPASRSVT